MHLPSVLLDAITILKGLSPRIPQYGLPTTVTTWGNGQFNPPSAPAGPPAHPPAEPAITTFYAPGGAPGAYPGAPAYPPAPAHPTPPPGPPGPPGGPPGGGPPGPGGGWPPAVVGGTATIVLSPDKTVIVENPAVTVMPKDDPAAWTQVPPGWYATTFYSCAGEGCSWYMRIRQSPNWNSGQRVGVAGWIWGVVIGMMVVAMGSW